MKVPSGIHGFEDPAILISPICLLNWSPCQAFVSMFFVFFVFVFVFVFFLCLFVLCLFVFCLFVLCLFVRCLFIFVFVFLSLSLYVEVLTLSGGVIMPTESATRPRRDRMT